MADERDEQEGGFTVRDRRRFLQDVAEESADAAPTATIDAPAAFATATPPSLQIRPDEMDDRAVPTEADFAEDSYDGMAAGQESNELPDIYSVVAMFLGEMRSHAILRLGLAPNPMTGQSERDLTQAKIAIDTAVFLGAQLEGVLPSEEKLPLRAMLSELQMLYVEQTNAG